MEKEVIDKVVELTSEIDRLRGLDMGKAKYRIELVKGLLSIIDDKGYTECQIANGLCENIRNAVGVLDIKPIVRYFAEIILEEYEKEYGNIEQRIAECERELKEM